MAASFRAHVVEIETGVIAMLVMGAVLVALAIVVASAVMALRRRRTGRWRASVLSQRADRRSLR